MRMLELTLPRLAVAVLALGVGVAGCGGDDDPTGTNGNNNSNLPVVVNGGVYTEWSAKLTTTGNAVYPTLAVGFDQTTAVLSGTNRDNNEEVDLSTTGTVDSNGNIVLTSVLTNGGSPRATIKFTGQISGSGSSQTISGTYEATGPSVSNPPETGTFTMDHT